MAIQMQEILTLEFFNEFSVLFTQADRQDIHDYIMADYITMSQFAQMSYDGLLALDYLEPLSASHRAKIAYTAIGDAFAKIFDALVANYNPLENFFTDRTMQDNLDSDTTRSGGYTDTPSGTKTRSFIDNGVTGMGTTFESYSDNDFRNISKTKSTGEIDDGFDNYQEQRVYNALTDTGNADRSIEEHRAGNSGIFSKQDLTNREIKLRLTYKIRPLLVRMIVDIFNKGVWLNED